MTTEDEEQRDWRVVPANDAADPLGDWQIFRSVNGVDEFFGGFDTKDNLEEDCVILNALERENADLKSQLANLESFILRLKAERDAVCRSWLATLEATAAGNSLAAGERGSGSVDLPGH